MNKNINLLAASIGKVIVGKDDTVLKLISALLCEGHVLLEDVPGVGKTQLITALSRSIGGSFNRIQLTPDVMPSDIAGFTMLDSTTGEFVYRDGAVMCNFLLADEINRASPKVQSALLEAMEERQISLDGVTHALPKPFLVMATQNPVETYGTSDGSFLHETLNGLSFVGRRGEDSRTHRNAQSDKQYRSSGNDC